MHLRISSAPDLIGYLREVLADEGESLFDLGRTRIVRHRGRLFFLTGPAGTVGGPFPDLGAMIRSEGIRTAGPGAGATGAEEPEAEYWACFEREWKVEGEGVRPLELHPVYANTHFSVRTAPDAWPTRFVILSAHATTGESWPEDRNEAADHRLGQELARRRIWTHRVDGFDPSTGHREPSWAADMAIDDALDLGRTFHQDAIFTVDANEVRVLSCRDGASVYVGWFRGRIVLEPEGPDAP